MESNKQSHPASALAPIISSVVVDTPKFVVQREKVCPVLVRVFTKVGSHHRSEEYDLRGKNPKDELQIYTWRDANLRELTNLVKEVNPLVRRRTTELSFAFVYPDKRGQMVLREVGKIHSVKKGEDDLKTLDSLHFEAGDFLDVAIKCND